jgi:hypothetical protein
MHGTLAHDLFAPSLSVLSAVVLTTTRQPMSNEAADESADGGSAEQLCQPGKCFSDRRTHGRQRKRA